MSRSFGESPVTIWSPIAIAPDVGSSRPATIRRAVVFPHPEGPTRIRNSPSAAVIDRWLTATAPPGNSFVTSMIATSAIVLSLQSRRGDGTDEVPLREEEHDEH